MSLIFKGDSIYKSGGGGGGYKDGGELIDGDFIKVENNTVSSYDNVSRDPLNFYFEVSNGEVLNSVIELTTTVNATINVYIVQNGLYIPLGNVGGDTVNAGDDYKLNVVGNSFMLEVVTPSQAEPEFYDVNGVKYPVMKVNNLLWSKFNLKLNIMGSCVQTNSFVTGYGNEFYYLIEDREHINDVLEGYGCRLPTYDDMQSLAAFCGGDSVAGMKLKSTSLWYDEGNGTDDFGFKAIPCSYASENGMVINYKKQRAYFLGIDKHFVLNYSSNSIYYGNLSSPNNFYTIRFVKDI